MHAPAVRRTTALALVAVQLLLPACAGMSEGEKKTASTVGGALVGAAAGAAIGGKKNRTGGILIGAVAGAAAGYLLAPVFGADAPPEEKAKPEFQEAKAHFDEGKAAQDASRFDAAIASYQAASLKAPNQPEPYVNMGYAYLDKGDRAAAEASFRRALELDPANAGAKQGLKTMGLGS